MLYLCFPIWTFKDANAKKRKKIPGPAGRIIGGTIIGPEKDEIGYGERKPCFNFLLNCEQIGQLLL